MSYGSYKEVAGLEGDTQRRLLQGGDPAERVWAAWALGIVLGGRSTPDLVISLHESPTPGTRSHLLVVLAGLGERDILSVFAVEDPDEDVRATAVRYLIRVHRSTDLSLLQLVRERLLHDPSPLVRETVLREAPAEFPSILFEDLRQLANDPDPKVRQVAAERLLATVALEHLFPGVLEERIPYEDQGDLRQRLSSLCLEAGGAARLLALCPALDLDRALEILHLLVESGARFSWDQLSPSSLRGPQYEVYLLRLLEPASTLPALPWLLQGIARAATWTSPGDHRPMDALARAVEQYAWHATQLLVTARASLDAIEPAGLGRDAIALVTQHLEEEISHLEWEIEDEEWEGGEGDAERAAIAERLELIQILERMNAKD